MREKIARDFYFLVAQFFREKSENIFFRGFVKCATANMKRKKKHRVGVRVNDGRTEFCSILDTLRKWWNSDRDRPDDDQGYRRGNWNRVLPCMLAREPADERELLKSGGEMMVDTEGCVLFFHYDHLKGRVTVYGGKQTKRGEPLGCVVVDDLTASRYIPPCAPITTDGWFVEPCVFAELAIGDSSDLLCRLACMKKAVLDQGAPATADGDDYHTIHATSQRGRECEAYGKACMLLIASVDCNAYTALAMAEGLMEQRFLRQRCANELQLLDVCTARHRDFVCGSKAASPLAMLDRRKCREWRDRLAGLNGLRLFGRDARAFTRAENGIFYNVQTNAEAPGDLAAHFERALDRHVHVWSRAKPCIVFCVAASDALGLCDIDCESCKCQCAHTRPVIHCGEAFITWLDAIRVSSSAVTESFSMLASVFKQILCCTDFALLHRLSTTAKTKGKTAFASHVNALAAVQDVRPRDRDARNRDLADVANERAQAAIDKVVLPRYRLGLQRITAVNPVMLGDALDEHVTKLCGELANTCARITTRTTFTEQRRGLPGSSELLDADLDIRKLVDIMPPCLRAIVHKSNSNSHPNYHERCLIGSFLLGFEVFLPISSELATPDKVREAHSTFLATWQRLFVQHEDAHKRSMIMTNFGGTEYGNAVIRDLVTMRMRKDLVHGCNFAVTNNVCPFSGGNCAEFCKRAGIEHTSDMAPRVFDITPGNNLQGTDLCRHRCERFFVVDNCAGPKYPIRSPAAYYRFSHETKRAQTPFAKQ